MVFGKDASNNLLRQYYMDFVLADSVQHFNDGKSGHAGIFSQIGLDVVSILTFIIGRTTPASVKKNTEKQKILDNLKGYNERTMRTITNW